MTRTVEEVEADLAAVKASWQDATEASRLARLAAEDLRRRAVADDSTVTAAALAAAEHESEFAKLKIEARKTATEALESELRVAKAERFADESVAAIQSLRPEYDKFLADLKALLEHGGDVWARDTILKAKARQTAATMGYHTATPRRVRLPLYGEASIDGISLGALRIVDSVGPMVDNFLGSLNARLR
jgi:hypothetical protein